jgi:DNA-binding MarR family transcriptional regulator
VAPNSKCESSCKPLPKSVKAPSPAECRILWAIRRFFQTNRHTPTLNELVELSHVPQRTAYDYVERLSERGFIERADAPKQPIMGLTPRGHAALRSHERLVLSLVGTKQDR